VDNLQLLLTGDKAFSDINVCFSASDNSISLQLGLSLIEKLRWDPDSLQYKMMIGRLANLGYPLRRIMEEFGHDHRTIRRWAKGLTTLNADELRRIYSGQGALSKVDDAVDCFVRSRYRDLCRTVRDYRERIRKEVQATFNVCLSGEILRQIFRREDADAFPVSPIPAGGEPVDKFLPVSVSESPAPRHCFATTRFAIFHPRFFPAGCRGRFTRFAGEWLRLVAIFRLKFVGIAQPFHHTWAAAPEWRTTPWRPGFPPSRGGDHLLRLDGSGGPRPARSLGRPAAMARANLAGRGEY
jgi:hypothetical protein